MLPSLQALWLLQCTSFIPICPGRPLPTSQKVADRKVYATKFTAPIPGPRFTWVYMPYTSCDSHGAVHKCLHTAVCQHKDPYSGSRESTFAKGNVHILLQNDYEALISGTLSATPP